MPGGKQVLKEALVHFIVFHHEDPYVPGIRIAGPVRFRPCRYSQLPGSYFIRDHKMEDGPFTRLTFDFYFTILQQYEVLCDGQSKAGTSVIPAGGIFCLPEPFKYYG